MSRYFFHVTNGNTTIPDDLGEDFDVVAAARGHALAVARELSRNGLLDKLAGRHISVVDEHGVVVFKVLMRAMVIFTVLLRAGAELFC
jgi:Domain of unknown function (DUF6894)